MNAEEAIEAFEKLRERYYIAPEVRDFIEFLIRKIFRREDGQDNHG